MANFFRLAQKAVGIIALIFFFVNFVFKDTCVRITKSHPKVVESNFSSFLIRNVFCTKGDNRDAWVLTHPGCVFTDTASTRDVTHLKHEKLERLIFCTALDHVNCISASHTLAPITNFRTWIEPDARVVVLIYKKEILFLLVRDKSLANMLKVDMQKGNNCADVVQQLSGIANIGRGHVTRDFSNRVQFLHTKTISSELFAFYGAKPAFLIK